MSTTLNQTLETSYQGKTENLSLYRKFMNWCEGQDRLLWLGIALAGHGCIITPLTILAVLMAGTNIFLFMLALVAMGISLVTNLAALPTRVTIPAFILSVIIDIAIIFSCVIICFDIAKTYI